MNKIYMDGVQASKIKVVSELCTFSNTVLQAGKREDDCLLFVKILALPKLVGNETGTSCFVNFTLKMLKTSKSGKVLAAECTSFHPSLVDIIIYIFSHCVWFVPVVNFRPRYLCGNV